MRKRAMRVQAWVIALLIVGLGSATPVVASSLLRGVDVEAASSRYESVRSRLVVIDEPTLEGAIERGETLGIGLFEDVVVIADHDRTIRNASGSVSWVGKVRGELHAPVVLVTRDGITVGSIRTGGKLYMLYVHDAKTKLHAVHEIDESSDSYDELEPVLVELDDDTLADGKARVAAMRAGEADQDDGSIHDLLVVWTQQAEDVAGGETAMLNLIDLGVTETNLSYEASEVQPRIRLIGAIRTDYVEGQPQGDPLDLAIDPDDGVMDEVPVIRDQLAADMVMLMLSGGGCGRGLIMSVVSVAHAEFAFCWVGVPCVSPGYSFQHELGHVQGGRHQWSADATNNAPFTFNHGYNDPVNGFRTIMAVNDPPNCPDCPRRLAWSNPDGIDPQTGAPMGIPEGMPEATDMRQSLNLTAWTVANFRVSKRGIFSDGFESGDTSSWSSTVQ